MKKNIFIVASVFIGILAIAIFLFVNNEKSKKETNKPNIPQELLALQNAELPSAKILADNGEEKNVTDFKNGKPTFIMYWASWCPDCKKQLPEIEKLHKEYKDKVNFVLINVMDGERETVEKAKKYIKDNNFTYEYYRSTEEAIDKYKVKSIPTKFVVNKNGIIENIHPENYTAYDELKKEIDKVL